VCEINKVRRAVAREFLWQWEIRGTSCTSNWTQWCRTENTIVSRDFTLYPLVIGALKCDFFDNLQNLLIYYEIPFFQKYTTYVPGCVRFVWDFFWSGALPKSNFMSYQTNWQLFFKNLEKKEKSFYMKKKTSGYALQGIFLFATKVGENFQRCRVAATKMTSTGRKLIREKVTGCPLM